MARRAFGRNELTDGGTAKARLLRGFSASPPLYLPQRRRPMPARFKQPTRTSDFGKASAERGGPQEKHEREATPPPPQQIP